MVYVGMFFIFFISVAAFSIDLSRLYISRSQAQKAADAAALSGAYQHANLASFRADFEARAYAARLENGAYIDDPKKTDGSYISPIVNMRVKTTYQPTDEFGVQQNNWFRVSVQRNEPTFFAGIFGNQFRNVLVGATSTALYETSVPIDINGTTTGTYGIAPGPANLSLFGPDGFYNNGDKYSTRKLANGQVNDDYFGADSNKAKKGYDFLVSIPEAFKNANSLVYLQVFDPDCYNASGTEANGLTAVDEMRRPDGSAGAATEKVNGANSQNFAVPKYTIYRDNGTPGNPSDDSVLAGPISSGLDKNTDMKWNDFFSGNPRDLPAGEGLRVNVISTEGSSENGFSLRVNNAPASSTTPFNSNNGTQVKADGLLPINFNIGGSISMSLGNVPVNAKGSQLSISKFDTDVGSTSVRYFCDPAPSNQPVGGYPGELSKNGTTVVETYTLPPDYAGGQWRAVYTAGAQDTSVWSMSYSGAGPGSPGKIRIIR